MHRYYYGLDGIRFFSAFAVCIFHLGFYAWASEYSSISVIFAGAAKFEALTPIAWMGWVGVEIFFVISGFVIANSANGATPFAFLRSRLIRLWPAAWICATVTLIVRLMTGETFLPALDIEYLRSLVLWPRGAWIDGVYWSLAVEIAFYAIVFCLLLTANFRRLPLIAWGLTLVSGAFLTLAMLKQMGLAAPGGWFDAVAAQADLIPLRHGAFFAIGIWLWMLSNRSLPRSAWVGLGLAFAFGILEIEMRAIDLRTLEATVAASQPLIAPVIVWLTAVGLIIASTRKPEAFAPRTEAGRNRLKLAGKVTYPLYLVHSAAGAATMRWLIEAGIPPYLALPAAIAIVLGIASLVAVYGEPAVRKPLAMGLDALGAAGSRVKGLALLFRRADAIPVKQS
ncbi:MAG: acyltransferase [Hyphomonadaceae bacterium]